MTKDEALIMAINLLETLKNGKENFEQSNIHIVCDCCNLALNTKWQGNKEFVGLTDDEIDSVWFEVVKENNFEGAGKYFARAIQQALKDKNT
jgi:hypothetical protein